MMRLFTVFTLLFLLSSNSFSSEHLKGSEAAQKIPGTTELWFKSGESMPHFIRPDRRLNLTEANVLDWLRAQFRMETGLQFTQESSHIGLSGIRHTSYAMSLEDVQIEFVRLTVHSVNGQVLYISGNLLPAYRVSNSVALSEKDALAIALNEINAAQYKWDIPEEEQWIKDYTDDVNASFYPTSTVVLIAKDLNYKEPDLKFAHRFDIYADQPYIREEVYVDAQTGDILFRHDLIREADSTGVAHTGYSGIQQIKTDFVGPQNHFRLYQNGRGNGIHTWNLKNSTSFSSAVDFTDDDNVWKDMQGLNIYGTDAHWAAEMTYDYFMINFGRNSIDNQGFALNNYVHYGEAFNNAFWDGQRMVFGDGNGLPFTTVDITGHEISHGLIDHTADLVYAFEPGALNESFSDIFGNCIEYFAKPNDFSWRIGEDRGGFIRDMSNPNLRYNPDTYEGMYWYVGPADNGGVHINSGVHNYWFYLLAEGGNGINDIGKSFNVKGIGMDNAAKIAYENLSSYLSPTSDYEEARFYSIIAAAELFGNCSEQHAATVNAWFAVGLGEEFVNHAVASFTADRLEFCTVPFTVEFTNKSVNGVSYLWDFGDGGSSTDENPSHTYNAAGEFSVKLSVDGEGCGVDENILEKYIKVVLPDMPQGEDQFVESGGQVELNAQSTSGNIYWFKDAAGAEILHMGNQFITGPIYTDTSFFVRSVVEGNVSETGADMQSSFNSGQYSSMGLGIVFDMLQDASIQAVTVNAGTEGERTIVIEDKNGQKVFEKIAYLQAGIQEVQLGAALSIGTSYEMRISGTNVNLWRSANAAYPYELAGVCRIVRNSIELEGVYPYFYNWKVKENDCQSEAEEITVGIDDIDPTRKQVYTFFAEPSTGGGYSYKIRFEFLSPTAVTFGLYSISGQKVSELTPPAYDEGVTVVDLNQLLDLNTNSGGVYFLTVNGGDIEKSERIIISTKGN